MSGIRERALSCLRDGRVQIMLARTTTADVLNDQAPFEVMAFVTSSRTANVRYVVDFMSSAWGCTCRDGRGCAHIAAVQLVTGHESAAAKLRAVS